MLLFTVTKTHACSPSHRC